MFFSRTGQFPTHVGILRDEESYIHAPGRDGTKIVVKALVAETIARNKQELLYSRNPIGYKSPTCVSAEPSYRYHQKLIKREI